MLYIITYDSYFLGKGLVFNVPLDFSLDFRSIDPKHLFQNQSKISRKQKKENQESDLILVKIPN